MNQPIEAPGEVVVVQGGSAAGLSAVRLLLVGGVVLGFLYVAQYAWRNFAGSGASGPHAYITLDWLINYSGGFVRRGISGVLVDALASIGGWAPVTVATLVQLAVYAVFCALLLRLTAQQSSWSTLLLVLSPLMLAFPVADPSAMLRKEILHYALFTWLACRYAKGVPLGRAAQCVLALLLPVLGLAHEIVFAVLPFYAGLLLAFHRRQLVSTRALRGLGAWLSLAMLAIALLVLSSQGKADPQALCRSMALPAEHLGPCMEDSAVSWLAKSSAYGGRGVLGNIAGRHYLEIYGFAMSMGLLTFALALCSTPALCRAARAREWQWATAASALLFIPFFAIALDWGRWLSILFTSATLLLLALQGRQIQAAGGGQPAIRAPFAVLLVSLCCCNLFWGIPHAAGADKLGFGVAGLVLGKLGL